jgi:adenylate cyclase
MTVLLSLVVLTVGGLGYSSYRNAQFTADDLSTRILDQASLRVDQRINDLLHTANEQGSLNSRLLRSRQFDVEAFGSLAAYWQEVMRIYPELTRLSVALEATGEWFYVRRFTNGKLMVGELRRRHPAAPLERSEYWPGSYPRQPFEVEPNRDADDPRLQPWYRAAKAAGRQTWSETYVICSNGVAADVPGVTNVTPIHNEDGSLAGVMTASFDLHAVCDFLKTLPLGRTGYAFAVELRAAGCRRVIAHPSPEILFRARTSADGDASREFTPLEALADQNVSALLAQVPPNLAPSDLAGMVKVKFTEGGNRYLGAYRCLSTPETPDWLICTVIPEAEVLEHVEQSNRQTVLIGLGVFSLAVLASLYIAAQVARPLEQLARETEAIGQFQLEARPPVQSIVAEVDRLAKATEEMKTGLRSFQKYVPADLVRFVLAAGQEARLSAETRRATIFFCDIVDFTAIAERMTPVELVQHLGEYMQALSAEVVAACGTVDKYIGDAIMAFWGAPATDPDHAALACRAAVGCQQRLEKLRAQWREAGKPLFEARIGIHTGEVVVGNIGSEARLNYTVIGDAVNLASRLEGLNKHYGTRILITESTFREAQDEIIARPVDYVSVKGKTERVLVYELLGLKDEVDRRIVPQTPRVRYPEAVRGRDECRTGSGKPEPVAP